MQIYRLLMPAKALDWQNSIIEGLFYSSINYGFCLPLLSLILYLFTIKANPFMLFFVGLFVLFVAPIIWPIIFTKMVKSKKIFKNLQIPFPKAWDFFFDKRKPCFVLIHLKNGKLIGGYYGINSYATSYPNEGDLYLELVYETDNLGHFGKCIQDSKGMLIRQNDYDYIELFSIPNQKEGVLNENAK